MNCSKPILPKYSSWAPGLFTVNLWMCSIPISFPWVKLTSRLKISMSMSTILKFCSRVSPNSKLRGTLMFKNLSSANTKITYNFCSGSGKSSKKMEISTKITILSREEDKMIPKEKGRRKIGIICTAPTHDRFWTEATVELILRPMIDHIWLLVTPSLQVKKLMRLIRVFLAQLWNYLK